MTQKHEWERLNDAKIQVKDLKKSIEALEATLEKADALAGAAKTCHDRFVAWAHKPDAKKALRSLEADSAFYDALTAYREARNK